MDGIRLTDENPPVGPNFKAVYRESLSNVNYEDRSYFDHSQFADSKATEKNVFSKYLQKESISIAQMVIKRI